MVAPVDIVTEWISEKNAEEIDIGIGRLQTWMWTWGSSHAISTATPGMFPPPLYTLFCRWAASAN